MTIAYNWSVLSKKCNKIDLCANKPLSGGTYAEFLEFLANDEQFYATDAQDLLEKTAFITQKMYGKLPTIFAIYRAIPLPLKAQRVAARFICHHLITAHQVLIF